MDRASLGRWLADRFTPDQWDRGVTRSDLLRAAQDERDLQQWFAGLHEGGLYKSPQDVLAGVPHTGWEDQGMGAPMGEGRAGS
jgi:hypothetical protein